MHDRLARWLYFNADYKFNVEYSPGATNGPADYLSRQAVPSFSCPDTTTEIFYVADGHELDPVLSYIKTCLQSLQIGQGQEDDQSKRKKKRKQIPRLDRPVITQDQKRAETCSRNFRTTDNSERFSWQYLTMGCISYEDDSN